MGPLIIFQCEALSTPELTPGQPADQGQRIATVTRPDHPARLIFPRALKLLVRMDWATPVERTSRVRALTNLSALGVCEACLHGAGIALPEAVDWAKPLDKLSAQGNLPADVDRPSPTELTCADAAHNWVERHLPLPNERDPPHFQAVTSNAAQGLDGRRSASAPSSAPQPP